MFSIVQLDLITSVIEFEKQFNCDLPNNSFYKSMAITIGKRVLGQQKTWQEIKSSLTKENK